MFYKLHNISFYICFETKQANKEKLTDAEVQFNIDQQVLLICTKLVLYFAFVGAFVVLCNLGDNMTNANLVAVGTLNVLLLYWTAKTICKNR